MTRPFEPSDTPAGGASGRRNERDAVDRRLSMRFLAESARDLNSSLKLEDVFKKIADRVSLFLDHHLFCIMLYDERAQLLEHSYSLRYGEHVEQDGGFPLGFGLSGSAALERRPIRVADVAKDPRYVRHRHAEVEIRSELVVPLINRGRLIGVLDIESKDADTFTEEDEQMVSALASHMAAALENARLYEEVLANQRRLEDELATARRIQKGLLPRRPPEIAGLQIGVAYEPARELGGDFYDFLPYGENRIGIAVGDVAGKATPAALYGSLTVGMMRGHALQRSSTPAEMLRYINEHLGLPSVDERYAVMIFGVYDVRSRSITLSNAGFPQPYLVRDGRVSRIHLSGKPLGVFADVEYREKWCALEDGDVLAFCSDGLADCEDRGGEPFGDAGIARTLESCSSGTASEITRILMRATDAHAGPAEEAVDDRTLVVLKVAPGERRPASD